MCKGNCIYCLCPCFTLNQKDCCTCCRYEQRLNTPICLTHGATLLSLNNPTNCCLVVIRLIMALFAIFSLISFYYWWCTEFSTIDNFGYVFIYFTQWSNLVATLYFILSFVLTYKIYKLQRKGVDITTISIEEISEYGLKTLIYFVGPCLVITLAFTVGIIMYWVFIFPTMDDLPPISCWPGRFSDISGHGIVFAAAVFDYYSSYKKMLYADVMVALWYGITYIIWSILFHHVFGLTDASGNPYIYDFLNWNEPKTAVKFSFIPIAAMIPVHLFYTFTKNCMLYLCNKNNNMYGIVERKSDAENEVVVVV